MCIDVVIWRCLLVVPFGNVGWRIQLAWLVLARKRGKLTVLFGSVCWHCTLVVSICELPFVFFMKSILLPYLTSRVHESKMPNVMVVCAPPVSWPEKRHGSEP